MATRPRTLAAETAEQHVMKLQRQLATEQHRFEVHVTGCAKDIGYAAADPDFGDFDATQALYHTLWGVLFDLVTPPRAKILGGNWVSQSETIQTLDTRGQKWVATIEIMQPVTDLPLAFIPQGSETNMTV